MHISPTLMLVLGCTAAFLFLATLVVAAIVTARNRRVIRRHLSGHK